MSKKRSEALSNLFLAHSSLTQLEQRLMEPTGNSEAELTRNTFLQHYINYIQQHFIDDTSQLNNISIHGIERLTDNIINLVKSRPATDFHIIQVHRFEWITDVLARYPMGYIERIGEFIQSGFENLFYSSAIVPLNAHHNNMLDTSHVISSWVNEDNTSYRYQTNFDAYGERLQDLGHLDYEEIYKNDATKDCHKDFSY